VPKSGGGIGGHTQSRLRVGGKVNELSVTSDDAGEEEAPTRGGEEGRKGRGPMKGATIMTVCGHDRVFKRKATIGSFYL